MKRREALTAIASCARLPAIALAQESKRVPVAGMLITQPPVTDPVVEAVRTGLRQYGYEDGKNIKQEVRTALGQWLALGHLAPMALGLWPKAKGARIDPIAKSIPQRALLAAILLLSALFSSLTFADNTKLPKIGELFFQDQNGAAPYQRALRNGLRELGYVDGKTATFVTRFADGDATKLSALRIFLPRRWT